VSEFTETFRRAAQSVLDTCPRIEHEWQSPLTLKIAASSASGFDVKLVCESYGLYPYAGEWHGAPWDAAIWKSERLAAAVREFLQSVLSPAGELRVRYSNGRPYKWTLRYSFEGSVVSEETGLIFFNWFGRRSVKVFRNEWAAA
jgi:hypothetical protein